MSACPLLAEQAIDLDDGGRVAIAPLTAGVILGAMFLGIMTGIVGLARGKDMVPFDKAQ